ncbi:MAG: hypothetical protein GXO65_03595, partial [Euryarchaeota archaeon]|nr:hypothetical protein [Euryarchaeota archaeon]
DERAFLPGKSIMFIRDTAISGVQAGESSDFYGMNTLIQQAIANYSILTGLNITLYNPDGDSCVPNGTCSVFNSNNVKVVPAPYGMYTLIEGDWRLVVRDNTTVWNITLPARHTLRFNNSGSITSTDYLIKSYTSIVGFQDPLIWWVLSKWSTAYRYGTDLLGDNDLAHRPFSCRALFEDRQ